MTLYLFVLLFPLPPPLLLLPGAPPSPALANLMLAPLFGLDSLGPPGLLIAGSSSIVGVAGSPVDTLSPPVIAMYVSRSSGRAWEYSRARVPERVQRVPGQPAKGTKAQSVGPSGRLTQCDDPDLDSRLLPVSAVLQLPLRCRVYTRASLLRPKHGPPFVESRQSARRWRAFDAPDVAVVDAQATAAML